MQKEPLIFMSILGLTGYGVFHGHQTGKDCWICPWRGLIFMGSSVALGIWLAFQEKE